jgi:UDP-GlcNAc:undecaprenyl-phosphate GlcNAc-1-phosphate transferase
MIYLLIFLCTLNYFILRKFIYLSKVINLFDSPDNLRKIHSKKTANIGGFLIYLNLVAFFIFYLIETNFFINNLFFLSKKEFFIFYAFLSLFFILGFIDDKFNLNANIKFIFFFIIIYSLLFFDSTILINEIIFSFYPDVINIKNFNIFFTMLSFLLFINAFNMFDGINLQSGIYSIIIFCIFIFKGVFVEISIVLILSLIVFLYLNYKNKCFLGDNGSILLSFIISFFFIKSYRSNQVFYADEIFLIMLIPGLDLLRVSIFRIIKKKHPFEADRNHMHHFLIERFNLKKSLLLLFLPILIFNLLSLVFNMTVYFIIISFLYYFILFYYLNKNKIK